MSTMQAIWPGLVATGQARRKSPLALGAAGLDWAAGRTWAAGCALALAAKARPAVPKAIDETRTVQVRARPDRARRR
jgi:hypothetical protein